MDILVGPQLLMSREDTKAWLVSRMKTVPVLSVMLLCLSLAASDQDSAKNAPAKLKIDQVFFAQHHVLTPEQPYFKLVGNLETLIKVQVYSETSRSSPLVVATLTLKSKKLELPLQGPPSLPKPPAGDPPHIEHKFEDSFTAYIPKEWIQSGLEVRVELREKKLGDKSGTVLDYKNFDRLLIGAPTRLVMTMFDIHFFGKTKDRDYPQGWFAELGARLPVAELELRRTKDIVFDKLVMQPRGGKPAVLCSSKDDYTKQTGLNFDGEQDASSNFNWALKRAAGATIMGGANRVYYANIYGVHAGGQAGGLSGVGNGGHAGILLHELGHAFSLPHWANAKDYPYRGPKPGIGEAAEDTPHVGPNWGFDLSKRQFISATHDGKFKHDPMHGGGLSKVPGTHIMTFFSDFSLNRIRQTFEKTQMIVDEKDSHYKLWDQDTGSYSKPGRQKGGPNFPIEDNVEVVSVMAAISTVTPQACYIYPPIGPYLASYIEPSKEASDYSLKITQGGKVRSFYVTSNLKKGTPDDGATYAVWAVNLPARDGDVSKAELIHVPDGKVLSTWDQKTSPVIKTEWVTDLYPKGAPSNANASKAPAIAEASKVGAPSKVAENVPPADASKATETAKTPVVSKPIAVRIGVPEALLTEWTGKLKQRIATASKSGKPLKGWVNVLGKPGNYPLAGCDEKELQVHISGNSMPVQWSWIKQPDLLALVKSLAKEDDSESLLMLTVFQLANGEQSAGETTLARAALLDSSAAAKLREQLK